LTHVEARAESWYAVIPGQDQAVRASVKMMIVDAVGAGSPDASLQVLASTGFRPVRESVGLQVRGSAKVVQLIVFVVGGEH